MAKSRYSSYRTTIPRPVLIGAGLMMVATLAFAIIAKRLPAGPDTPAWAASAPAAAEGIALRFEDQEDGSVLVIDATDDSPITTFEPGTNGFARTVLRGMVKERLGSGGDRETAFRLQRTADGGLMLGDPATGREIHLAAFGPASLEAFERLMPAGEQAR